MKNASPWGSLTKSLNQGVSRFSRLFRLHVQPAPVSLTMNPIDSLAMTLVQGCGGSWRPPLSTGFNRMTYSRPADAKPPYPFSNWRDSWGETTSPASPEAGLYRFTPDPAMRLAIDIPGTRA